MAMSVMAATRGGVIRSPKKKRPPSMTIRMSMHATITPCQSGTSDMNASHMRNSTT